MKFYFQFPYLLLLIFVFLRISVFGQYNKFAFENITLDKGLSQSHINCILQDKKGFIWVGTRGGLNRYDGSNFKVYFHDPSDSTSISNNIIYSIYEDENGLIWIGTQNGLTVFDHKFQNFRTFQKDPNSSNSLSDNAITAIQQDTLGNYWVGTQEGGINKISFPNGLEGKAEFTLYQNIIGNPQSISSNRITAITADRFGFLWVGTQENGLNKFNPETGKSIRYLIAKDNSGVKINTIFESFNGEIWVGTNNGLKRIFLRKGTRTFEKNETIVSYTHNPKRGNSISSNSVMAITQTDSLNIWIGTDDAGINKFDFKRIIFYKYQYDDTNKKSLISNNIKSMSGDYMGALWVGTNSGISKGGEEANRFKLYHKDPSIQNTLTSSNVQMLYKERSGIIWIGTFDGGLNKYDSKTKKYTAYTSKDIFDQGISRTQKLKEEQEKKAKKKKRRRSRRKRTKSKPKPKPLNLSNDRVLSLHRDKNKTVWIGTGDGGLNKLDLRTETFSHYKAVIENPDSLSNNTIRVIYEDEYNNLWLGTEGGLNKFDGNKFKRYINDVNDINSLSHNDVRAIIKDKKGNFWIGTFGGGLNKFNPKTGQFFRYQKSEENSLPSNAIFCLHEDQSGFIWVGTSTGFSKFDPEDETFINYSDKDGLPNNFVYGILDDNKGNLWLSTNKGISRFNIENQIFKVYDKRDGLQSNEFNPGAFFKTPFGEMLFGGINGFNSFYPKKIKDNEKLPSIVITEFRLFNTEVPIGTNDSPLEYHISETKRITLPYTDNVFSFEFVGLSFTHAEKNQYAYKLENFEDKWVNSGTRRFANYTNIPPGKYIFRVKASNNDGLWNEEGVAIEITITPPFWKTWWFYLILVLSISSIVYGYIKHRLVSLYKKQQDLEKKVQIRTSELQIEKDRVEMANKEILEQKDEISTKNKELTKKNTDITSSIFYAKRIQEAILPININKDLPESFVFYQPRDIVSGDFYWYTEKNGKLIIAAVDCTGHGVPGAFMSMIGNTLLNEIVNSKGVEEPSEILKFLNIGVRNALKQDNEEVKSRDGMDMGICSIDMKDKKLEYAGAKRPLYLIKNEEFHEIKGDKASIGGTLLFKDHSYTNHIVNLEKEQTIYLSSDGYADQIGGPENRKYMTKKFKQFLLQNNSHDLNTQKSILIREFENWKGDEKQLDDILVIGIRLRA
ncbi:MAG: SpoIIE family protein phosphatase [Flammeovirgaceae bacterium]|nr:SpoIIE family protein phosphatase [Flammeovirgaceae bacterium]